MPIRIPDNLPARKTLENEGVNVMDSSRAARQDIRPLEIGLLNLMPNKERTETQFARLIGSTPLQIDMTLVRITDLGRSTVEDATVTLNKEVFADIGMSDEESRALAAAIQTLRHNSGDF